MDKYSDPMGKLALAVDSVQMAKSFLIESEGIGQDIPMTMLCWHDDLIEIMLQAGPEVSKATSARRIADLSSVALIAKSGWMAESITLVVEGYCQLDSSSTDVRPLDQAFVDTPSVSECLTFMHVDRDEDPLVMVSPYSVGLGRVTSFSEPKFSYKEPFRKYFDPLIAALQYEIKKPIVNPVRRVESAEKLIESLGWSALKVPT